MTDKLNNNDIDNEMSFFDLLIIIKKWLIYLKSYTYLFLVFGMIGSCMGLVYYVVKKPIYIATLTFAMEDEKSTSGGLGGALGLASSLGFDIGGGASSVFSGSNVVELMKSRKMIEQTLLRKVIINKKETKLLDLYIDFNGTKKGWEKAGINEKLNFSNTRDQFSLQMDSVLGIIYKSVLEDNLKVSQKDKKVSIISIDVSSRNQIFSKYFAETLAKEVSEFYIETKSSKAKKNVEILEKQVDSVRNELNKAISGVAIANDNTYNLNPALNIRRIPSAQKQVDVQANTAILTQLVANLELARVTLRRDTPLIQIIDYPILPLSEVKISIFKSIFVGLFFGIFATIFFLTYKKIKTQYFK